jgi:hypothetical protein
MTNATNKFLALDDRTFEIGSGEKSSKENIDIFKKTEY